jgi:hypothetical protein
MAADNAPRPLKQLADEELLARLPQAAALPDAPAEWIQRAVDAWQPPLAARVAQAAEALRQQVQAWLSFDSWATAPLAAGLRSTATSVTRQLVFSAEGRDVDLRIAPGGDTHYLVSGQVLGPDEAGTVVLVTDAADGESAVARQAPLDELGEFQLSEVRPGRYRLSLLLASQEIVLPTFDVGGPVRFGPKDGGAG